MKGKKKNINFEEYYKQANNAALEDRRGSMSDTGHITDNLNLKRALSKNSFRSQNSKGPKTQTKTQ